MKFYRRIGLYEATIYLESSHLDDPLSDVLNPESRVEIFGEFSPEEQWKTFIPCEYDRNLNCFKVDLFIQIRQ